MHSTGTLLEENRLQEFREGDWGWGIYFDNKVSEAKHF
jgi:hypothetical protein